MRKCIIKETAASLYAAPTIQSVRVDEALCGMRAQVLSDRGAWVKIRMSYGYEGYVEKECLCAPPESSRQGAPQTPAERHSEMQRDSEWAYVVRAVAADVLAAPDVKAPLFQTMTTGCMLSLAPEQPGSIDAAQCASWQRIRLPDGRQGYIRVAFLKPAAASADLSALRSASTAAAAALRQRILQTAMAYRGTQYRWGGKSPLGIDCSGLCFMAYWLNGIVIYRDARIESDYPVTAIPFDAAQKGDLLFFPGHVGLYLEKGWMLHASEADNGVKIVPLTAARMQKLLTAGSVFA